MPHGLSHGFFPSGLDVLGQGQSLGPIAASGRKGFREMCAVGVETASPSEPVSVCRASAAASVKPQKSKEGLTEPAC